MAAIRGTTAGIQIGRVAEDVLDCANHRLPEFAGRTAKRLTHDLPANLIVFDFVLAQHVLETGLDHFGRRARPVPEIGEQFHVGRRHVAGSCAGFHIGDLAMAGGEVPVAVVPLLVHEIVQEGGNPVHRVVEVLGECRVSLDSVDLETDINGTTPAHANGVAKGFLAGGFANQAIVRLFSPAL